MFSQTQNPNNLTQPLCNNVDKSDEKSKNVISDEKNENFIYKQRVQTLIFSGFITACFFFILYYVRIKDIDEIQRINANHISLTPKVRPDWLTHALIKDNIKHKNNNVLTTSNDDGPTNEHNVGLQNLFNRMYTGRITVGSNDQDLDVVFDTGSADLWVLSKQAYEDYGKPDGYKYFDEDTSEL
eukprot:UN30227